jgi:hypothetical protein
LIGLDAERVALLHGGKAMKPLRGLRRLLRFALRLALTPAAVLWVTLEEDAFRPIAPPRRHAGKSRDTAARRRRQP